MNIKMNHELTEQLNLLQQGVSKLIDCNSIMEKNMQGQSKINSLQLVTQAMQEETIRALDKRLEHMEEYIDKLTKRVKELEANSSNANTHNRTQPSNCTHRYK